jgi:hypothetical protein
MQGIKTERDFRRYLRRLGYCPACGRDWTDMEIHNMMRNSYWQRVEPHAAVLWARCPCGYMIVGR